MSTQQQSDATPAWFDALQRFYRSLYKRRINNQFDALIPVVASEGLGKSTFMLQSTWIWQQVRGLDPTPASVLDRVVWNGREEFKTAIANWPNQQAIVAGDAARVLHKREAMHGEQIEIEKDLLDVRTKEHLIFLGFQDWNLIPSMLQQRRAQFAFHIPRRGIVHGYSRESLDEKVKLPRREWPDPDLKVGFPSLEGTELWEQYQDKDLEQKERRIQNQQSPDPEDARREEKIRVALRAVKPWDEDAGVTYREAGDLVDFSRTWVAERVAEWRNGEYEDLVDSRSD